MLRENKTSCLYHNVTIMSEENSESESSQSDVSVHEENSLDDIVLTAAEKNDVVKLKELLEKDPSLVNVTDSDSYTPLHRACYMNNVEAINVLLSYKADVRARTSDNWEPLHCAGRWDNVEAAAVILQNGGCVNARSKGGLTALHLAAAHRKSARTLELLLWQPETDCTLETQSGDTAYDVALRSGTHAELFRLVDDSLNVC
ncbi:ankyrin repeat domain-containing protein 49-like isoform X3 [Tachypleus tridentatus]|uniref:ankyrin repeat domain-containing protein 49-like isoform X3 n=1 Tax=Tachypleus tridentatus TaxID=6853 RepID=UPI003FD386B7